MPPYVFPPTQTSLVSFSSLFTDPTSSRSYTVHLTDATEHRSRFRDALKAYSNSKGDGELLSVVETAQSYLPLLTGLIGSLDEDDILTKSELAISWKSPLTPSASSINLWALGHELIFVLVALAASLNNLSQSLIQSASTTSSSSSSNSTQVMTSSIEKRQIDNLSNAADHLCRASGVFETISNQLIPSWEGQLGELVIGDEVDAEGDPDVRPIMGRKMSKMNPLKGLSLKGAGVSGVGKGKGKMPLECNVEVIRALAMMTLADANAIAILKLISPFHPSITLQTTSLPLPKGHPPPGLLAKLNLHVASLYSGARSLLKSNGQDIDRPLLDYLKKESGLADIRARKWLGVEAGETPGGSKIGLALAWLEDAAKRLRELQTGGQVGGGKTSGFKEKMKGLKLDSGGREERKERKGRLGVEEADIEAFTKLYKHMNQTVHFQPIPLASTLQTLLPSGRPVLAAKPFTMPRPAFGPGSVGYVTKKTSPPVIVDDTSTVGDAEEINADKDKQEEEDATGGLAVWGNSQDVGTRRTDYF